MLEITGL